MIDLQEFKDNYAPLKTCCFVGDTSVIDQVKAVHYFIPSVPDEDTGYAITEQEDGTFVVFEEWQDYSGHGCQCGSKATTGFTSLDNAIRFGLDDKQREFLGITLEEEK